MLIALLAVGAFTTNTKVHSQMALSDDNGETTLLTTNGEEITEDGEDYDQCEFPVIVNETDPNCQNIDELITVVTDEITALGEAKIVAEHNIQLLRESYEFIRSACMDGPNGIVGNFSLVVPPTTTSLLEVNNRRFSRFNRNAKNYVSTDLLEARANKAFSLSLELIEDAPHCSEEERQERCDSYLRETNETLSAFEEFSAEITTKTTFLIERKTILIQWRQDNYDFCQCNDSSTYTHAKCCGILPFSSTTECSCYYDPTQDICCTLPAYENSTLCQCKSEFDATSCCPLTQYSSLPECTCRTEFSIDKCCDNVQGFENDIRCQCEEAFQVPSCCHDGISEHENDKRCQCYYDFTEDCCTIEPEHPKCKCEFSWNTAYCCATQQYGSSARCQCRDNFTENPCCKWEEYQQNIECQCNKNFDENFCCGLPKYENNTYCQCRSNFTTSCCSLDEYEGYPECVCQTSFTPATCCQYSDFQTRKECQCRNQNSSTSPLDCCDQDIFSTDHECICRNQTQPFGLENCCDHTKFNTTKECLCSQQNTPTGELNCCEFAPFNTSEEYAKECACASQLVPIDDSVTPASNCCEFDWFKDTIRCKCHSNSELFDTVACCPFPEFTNTSQCDCYRQTDNPLSPKDCCADQRWSTDDRCACYNQTNQTEIDRQCCAIEDDDDRHDCFCSNQQNSSSPYLCCDTKYFDQTDDCICQTQQTPLENGHNCCAYPQFSSQLECVCLTNFNPADCCGLPDYSDDKDLCPPPNPCDNQTDPLYPINCCNEERFTSSHECLCLSVDAPVTAAVNCCNTSQWENNIRCLCDKQDNGLSPHYCCDQPQFEGSYECMCDAQTVGIDYHYLPPRDCCNTTKFKDSLDCLCAKQEGSLLEPEDCCSLPQYYSEPECICSRQTEAKHPHDCCAYFPFNTYAECICTEENYKSHLDTCCSLSRFATTLECKCEKQSQSLTPLDCCSAVKFANDLECACRANFTTDKCCGLYPNDDRCQCARLFTVPKCCVYDPSNALCENITNCYTNDTYPIEVEEVTEHTFTDDAIILDRGLIFFNPLMSSNSTTIKILKYPLNGEDVDPVQINTAALTENGAHVDCELCHIYSPVLPWNGTFSINLLISSTQQGGSPFTVYSTAHFAITAQVTASSIIYEVEDTRGSAATVNVTLASPSAEWWSSLEGSDRSSFFDQYIPQKVELAFQGIDCWLNIISVNDQIFRSGVWACLKPQTHDISGVASNDIKVRNHFGAFRLGYNIFTNQLTPEDAMLISNAYMVAGTKSPGVLRRQVIVPAPQFSANLSTGNESRSGLCEVAWDWGRVSILPAADGILTIAAPGVGTSECGYVPNELSAQFGIIGAAFLHSFGYIPEYQLCGTVEQSSEDLFTKTHVCDVNCGSTGLNATDILVEGSLGLSDLISIATNFEDYNPTLALAQNGSFSGAIYLVADKSAGIRTVIPLTGDHTDFSGVEFAFTLDVVSFPYIVYDAAHADVTAELVFNVRVLGQKTISVVFLIKRNGKSFTIRLFILIFFNF